MMGFKSNIGKRDNYVVARLNNRSEDAFGNIAETTNANATIEFWAAIDDVRSNRRVDDGKRRDVRMKKMRCDSRDVEGLTLSHRLTVDGDPSRTFIPMDFYESDFKYETTIIVRQES